MFFFIINLTILCKRTFTLVKGGDLCACMYVTLLIVLGVHVATHDSLSMPNIMVKGQRN